MSVFSCVALITGQNVRQLSVHTILGVSKRICCLYDNFIISGLHDLLQVFFSCLLFLSAVYVLHVPPHAVARGVRPGDLTGQACRPTQVRDTRQWCLPEMEVSLKAVQKNWYRTVSYCVLQHWNACSDVMVDKRTFFIQNDSYNILKLTHLMRNILYNKWNETAVQCKVQRPSSLSGRGLMCLITS
jgi:hypothetical protein